MRITLVGGPCCGTEMNIATFVPLVTVQLEEEMKMPKLTPHYNSPVHNTPPKRLVYQAESGLLRTPHPYHLLWP
jgi:hypothetical protein